MVIAIFAKVNRIPANILLLVKRLSLLLLIYSSLRLIFFLLNLSFFSDTESSLILKSFFVGLRYDITAIVISNIVFIVMHLLPFQFFFSVIYQKILKLLFFIVNTPLILLSCIDIGYFRFAGKRSGADVLSVMSFGKDFIDTLPSMIRDFWYLVLLFIFVLIFLLWSYPGKHSASYNTYSRRRLFNGAILSIVFALLAFIGFRGGIQFKPLNVLSATRYGTGSVASLILNSPFTVIKTFGKKTLHPVNWMTRKEAELISPVIKYPEEGKTFRRKNVVVILLESVGKEYIGSLGGKYFLTPFLDSLMNHSLVFTNAYANGRRSMEGIPAVIAGLPSLMPDPFIVSAYTENTLTTIPNLLREADYTSIFFHGGTNGTMNFDNFSRLAGFDHYFGRNEYNNDADFDGSWGIYDAPFLQRTAIELNKMKQPFFATAFTLTSHHPYKIPDLIASRFPADESPFQHSIRYTDFALKNFFATASRMPFFNNTLFVITADHTAMPEGPFYSGPAGIYSIPVIFYSPTDSLLKGKSMRTIQQIDILPSIMDYLDYEKPFFALGESAFNSSPDGCAINVADGLFQIVQGSFLFRLDTLAKNQLYNFNVDSLLKNNLVPEEKIVADMLERKLRATVQNYVHSLINNEMTVR